MIAIAAMSKNRVIGNKGTIPWHVKEDFQWFKEFTMGKTLVMGRRTYDSIPPLKGRKICVLSSNPLTMWDDCVLSKKSDRLYVRTTRSFISELEEDLSSDRELTDKDETWINSVVAGGAKTYTLLLPYITKFYVTHIDGEYEGDTFMSPFEHLLPIQEIIKEFGSHKVVKYSK